MSLATPLARVLGLGSARQGTHHWWQQRVTAVLLAPLCLWFIGTLLLIDPTDYRAVLRWIHSPVSAVLLILLIAALFQHAQLGLQVVIEDYIDSEWQKIAGILLVKFLALVAALASVLSVLRVYFL
jgi:succinate dehydrogenase / fumarate reductase membrane anchor subunit